MANSVSGSLSLRCRRRPVDGTAQMQEPCRLSDCFPASATAFHSPNSSLKQTPFRSVTTMNLGLIEADWEQGDNSNGLGGKRVL